MTCEEKFFEIYGREPEGESFCPYRVSPLGAHVDHQYGKITGLAINKGIRIAYSPKHNGVVEVTSLNFPKRAQFVAASVPEVKQNDWADHLRGATKVLNQAYPIRTGLCGVIEGGLPIGGLSSSAAVIIAFLAALCKLNNIRLTPMEMILMAKRAENEYVGVNCGKLDQSCEVLCRKDKLLYLDTKDDSYQLIDTPSNMKPYKIAILFSGLERSLADSKYNLRVDECKSAAYALMAFSGMEYGKYEDTRLRDVPSAVYEQYRDRLPEVWRKRSDHYFGEVARAEAGAEAWKKGDIDTFGTLMFASGYSSIHNYECGCPELIRLYEILTETNGVYGGRFSGAGFKGCCMALIDPKCAEQIEKRVTEKYLETFPNLKGKYSFHLCSSADGIILE